MTALLLVLAVIGLYLLACRIWPYVECGRCDDGRHPSPSGKGVPALLPLRRDRPQAPPVRRQNHQVKETHHT